MSKGSKFAEMMVAQMMSDDIISLSTSGAGEKFQ
jgi:hypothetical protein